MPELPEVETTLRGIKPHIAEQTITNVIIRHTGLRWPIPNNIKKILIGCIVKEISRRGKYLLFETLKGSIIMHLGMSGRLRILQEFVPPAKHDHIDLEFSNGAILRFTDPRRFGAFLWQAGDVSQHPLLANLGPEPFSTTFNAKYLLQRAKGRSVAVKSFLMDSKTVVGVGNIYANEALYEAGIHPKRSAGKIDLLEYQKLVVAVKKILKSAIRQGGTTLKDFSDSEGKKGYFKVYLNVYGRGGLPCFECGKELNEIRLGQRTTVFCSSCQK